MNESTKPNDASLQDTQACEGDEKKRRTCWWHPLENDVENKPTESER